MFELINSDSEKPLKRLGIISLVVYFATAASLVPWTYFILEMLGPLSLVGMALMALLVLGGYGLFKQWRGAKAWALVGPAVTLVVFLFSLTGVLMETGGNQSEGPPPGLIFMLVSPLVLAIACLIVTALLASE